MQQRATAARTPSRVFLLADDLTGACDAAIAFTPVAEHVDVQLSGQLTFSADVVAFQTASRDVDPAEATRRIEAALRSLPGDVELFKKVDSVFRGNTFAEIAAVARLYPADLVLMAPAYPAMGRRVKNGLLHIQSSTELRHLPLLPPLAEHGCHASRLATAGETALIAQLQAALATNRRVLLCDATEQEHLESLARAARALNRRILWVGSGGLAHALAAAQPLRRQATLPARSGGVLMFIGSDHPVTRGQVTCLQRLSGLSLRNCSAPVPQGPGLFHIPRNGTTADQIRTALQDIHPADTGCLFMTGGDTALAICEALGIHSLRLQEEFAPGVPLGLAQGGRFDGVPVILKSGGFGSRDLLCRLLDRFQPTGDVAA